MGVSLFGSRLFTPQSYEVLNNVHLPERTLILHLTSSVGEVTACSFHIPPGVNWKEIKPQTQVAIAKWLGDQKGSAILGMDANAPKIDHPDPLKNEWWWKDEPLLLGEAPLHGLRDAYQQFLANNPAIFQKCRSERPNGPLAISHMRGRGVQRTPCRYDFIFVSRDVLVEEVNYIFDTELSDHALVVDPPPLHWSPLM